ncbi:leucine efflux protein LeuE [Streptomyces sp. NPDC006487]|uniref:leucine efflux protein LeuE n=1 Tax=Streptomyces sp. NPDC006487 TaxID=3364748 RepID=UPI003687F574
MLWGTQHLHAFALAALLFVLLPGPSSLGTLTAAAQDGRRAGLRCTLGVLAGEVTLMALTVLGAAHLIRADPQVVAWVRGLGAVYIAWLGLGMLRTALRSPPGAKPGEPGRDVHGSTAPGPAGTRRSYVVTVFNPKLIVFFLTSFLQFADPSAVHPHLAFVVLGGTYELISASYLTCLVLAAARIGRAVGGRPRLTAGLQGAAGVLFLGFGAALAMGL